MLTDNLPDCDIVHSSDRGRSPTPVPMKIGADYSHLNGLEFLMVRNADVVADVKAVIASVNAQAHRTKLSKEVRKAKSGLLYSPIDLNAAFRSRFNKRGWQQHRANQYVASDPDAAREVIALDASAQREALESRGLEPIFSYTQTDFRKSRVHIEVQFGKYSFVAYDMFVKHMTFFSKGEIDVGIEIVPMKSLQQVMSSGVPYYQSALHDLVRQGRSSPAVPLWLIGIEP